MLYSLQNYGGHYEYEKTAPWAQKIEVDNQVLPFTEAKLTVDINDQEVLISIRGNAFHRHTCKEMFDPNVLHTVTLTLRLTLLTYRLSFRLEMKILLMKSPSYAWWKRKFLKYQIVIVMTTS